MTKYLYDVPFSSQPATDQYRVGWDAIFGAKKTPTEPLPEAVVSTAWGSVDAPEKPCPCESACAFADCHGKLDPEGE